MSQAPQAGEIRCDSPACGYVNPPGSRFCAVCGKPIRLTGAGAVLHRLKFFGWILPVALAIGLYAPGIRGELVWDDGIVQKDQMVAFRTIKDAFFFPRGIPQWSMMYYRPTVTLTYMAERNLYGPGAIAGPRATNVAIHALATLFVWMLARQVLRTHRFVELGAVAAALLFAAHPIHTESLCQINGRSDPLATMFMLAAVVAALAWRDCAARGAWARGALPLVVSPLLFLAALLSKEVGIATLLMLPGLLLFIPPLMHAGLIFGGLSVCAVAGALAGTAAWNGATLLAATQPSSAPFVQSPAGVVLLSIAAAGLLAGGAAFAMARFGPHRRALLGSLAVLALFGGSTVAYAQLRQQSHVNPTPPLKADAVGTPLSRAAAALDYYLIKSVWPWPQSAFPHRVRGLGGDEARNGFLPYAAVAIAGVLTVAGLLLYRRFPALVVAMGWTLLCVAPSLAIAVRNIAETPVAERYLYAPSVGVCLLVGGLLAAALPRVVLAVPMVLVVLVAIGGSSVATLLRASIWTSNLALWGETVKREPDAGLPWHSLGQARMARASELSGPQASDMLNQAIAAFDKALETYDDDEGRSLAWNSKGACLMRLGKLSEAAGCFEKSTKIRPGYATPWFNLGMLGLTRVSGAGAPTDPNARMRLLSYSRGFFMNALRSNPRYVWAYLEFGRCMYMIGTIHAAQKDANAARTAFTDAERSLDMVLKLDPNGRHAAAARELLGQVRTAAGTPPAAPSP